MWMYALILFIFMFFHVLSCFYFTSIFTDIVLYYCYCCCYCYCYCCSRFLTKIQNFRKNRNIKGTLSGLRQFLATESPLKVMKNAFLITSKALFILKIFKFLLWLFGHVSKTAWLKRLTLISNFMTSQPG